MHTTSDFPALLAGRVSRTTPPSGGSGGGGDYHAPAVHFSGTGTYLDIASLTATDNAHFSFAGWFNSVWDNDMVAFVTDPENDYYNYLSAFSIGGISINVGDGSISTVVNHEAGIGTGWHSIIFTMTAAPSRIIRLAIDEVVVDPTSVGAGEPPGFVLNGLPFALGDDTFDDNFIGDMCDVRIMPGISLLTAGELAPATIALFSSGGKPVNPAVATAALGAPCMLFSGDAAGFVTNQGTGGAFTLHGSLTDASTSPSD